MKKGETIMKQIDKLIEKAKWVYGYMPRVFIAYSQEEVDKIHQEHGDEDGLIITFVDYV